MTALSGGEQVERSPLRVLVVLAGDLKRDPETYIKYNTFIEALDRRFVVSGVFNAKLRGFRRILNAIPVWHPNWRTWSERASKSVSAFAARSQKASRWVRSMRGQADAVIQLGVLFDSSWSGMEIPTIIYTDYTARLSARRRDAGRSPLKGPALMRWFELEEAAMKKSAHVSVRSQLVRRSMLEDYGLSARQVSVIGGGVNLEFFPAWRPRPQNKPPTVLFIGLDYYRKGGDLTLQAFSIARQAVPEAQLLFVTADPIPRDMSLNGVKVIPPVWDRQALARLYEQADVFVLPSRLETWGDVLLEAMAYGLPCIGVNGQSMEEIIRHNETGFLVPPEDVPSLAQALTDLLVNYEMRARMSLAGYNLVAAEFTWDHVVARLAPIINRAVEQNRLQGER
jgi:glycosyltransferase involved in cell wall biosynthesis